jgi:hypothetical protein
LIGCDCSFIHDAKILTVPIKNRSFKQVRSLIEFFTILWLGVKNKDFQRYRKGDQIPIHVI